MAQALLKIGQHNEKLKEKVKKLIKNSYVLENILIKK